MVAHALVIGETLVDLIDDHDEHGELLYRPRMGGSPFNVAVGVARQGTSVELATAIGRDTFGKQSLEFLETEGVGTSLAQHSLFGTCLAVVTTAGGHATYDYFGDRESMTDIHVLPDEATRGASVIHASSTALNTDPVRSTVRLAFENSEGFRTVDPNPRPALISDTDDYVMHLRKILPSVDLLKLSNEDIKYLWPTLTQCEAVQQIRGWTSAVLTITQGAQNTLVFCDQEEFSVPVPDVVVADPTGAGDTFMASLISNIVANGVPETAVGWSEYAGMASIAASVTCSRIGGAVSMPTSQEVFDQCVTLGWSSRRPK